MSDYNEQKTRYKVMENSDEVTVDDPCTHCGSFQHTGKGFIVTIILVSLVSFLMCSLLLSVEHRARSNLLS